MVGIVERDRTQRYACSGASRSSHTPGDRTIRCHPGFGAPLGLNVSAINVRDPREIERAVATFARLANGGLVATASPGTVLHRDLIVALADRYKLPTVYWDPTAVSNGGLIAYGTDLIDQHRQAASYVDRIPKGEKPADLPVQAPNKYQLAINLKTAKALGLIVSPALLARADKVIE